MTGIKEIDGKYYKECGIIMLMSTKHTTSLLKVGNKLYNFPFLKTKKSDTYQHLYITSNEEIKESDWCFEVHNGSSLAPKSTPRFTDEQGNTWWLRQMNMNCSANDPQAKKIIATTDKSLDLPEPSKKFIEAYVKTYNEGKPITEVLVEYEIGFE